MKPTPSDTTVSVGPDPRAQVGTRGWAEYWRGQMHVYVKQAVSTDPALIESLVQLGSKHRAWELLTDRTGRPFATFDAFCEAPRPHGLGTSSAKLEQLYALLHENRAQRSAVRATPAPTKADAAKKGGKAKAAKAKGALPRDDDNEAKPRGTDPAYLAARIARDAPAVHEDMKAGKYPSVRAAAKAAGILKEPDPVKVAAREVAKVPVNRLAELVAAMPEQVAKMLLTCLRDRLNT